MYIASQRPVGVRAAGRVADGAIMQGCVAEPLLAFFRDTVSAGAREAGMGAAGIHVAESHEELARRLRAELAAGDWVLVKGSRSMHMERIADAWRPYRSVACWYLWRAMDVQPP